MDRHSDTDKVRGSSAPAKRQNATVLLLPIGTVLRKEYPRGSGKIHEVEVQRLTGYKPTTERRVFIYNGVKYRSLTRIATEITGKGNWSGPYFFGLWTPPAKEISDE